MRAQRLPQLRRRRSIRIACRYFAPWGRSPRLATSFFDCKADRPSERLVYGSAATNSTPSLAELATIHSTVYSSRVPVGDGLRSVYIYRNTARCYLRRNRNRREDRRSE